MNHQKWRWRRFDNSTCGVKIVWCVRTRYIIVPVDDERSSAACACLNTLLLLRAEVNEKEFGGKSLTGKESFSHTHTRRSQLLYFHRNSSLLLSFPNQNTTYTRRRRERSRIRREKSKSQDLASRVVDVLRTDDDENFAPTSNSKCVLRALTGDDTRELSRTH